MLSKNHSYKVAIITASDKGFAREREDLSGPEIKKIVESKGYIVSSYHLLPDDQALIAQTMHNICTQHSADLILTTGGTGLSPRDCTPEATLSIATKIVPGIAEAMRSHSLTITNRAMLSRAVCVICEKTLIINLPGSPKAVYETLSYIIDVLEHALATLLAQESECAR